MAKILFVSAVGGHGGPVASLLDILPAFQEHITICAGSWSDFIRTSFNEMGIDHIVQLPRPRGVQAARTAVRLRRLLKKYQPDLIFANGLTEASLVAIAQTGFATSGQVPVWVWVHNYELPTLTSPTSALIHRKAFYWAAVSELAADLVVDNHLATDPCILSNPLNPANILSPERIDSPDAIRIVYLGTDRTYKGFQHLAPLMQRTRDLPLQWRLHTGVGEEERWAGIRTAQQAPDLDVQQLGRVHPVSEAYKHADIVLIPSLQESFCRVAAEAMANGIPVVATDLQPLQSLVGRQEEAGILASVGDLDAFAKAIRRLATDRNLRHRMGERGRVRAKQYDLKKIQDRWRTLVEQTLASRTSEEVP